MLGSFSPESHSQLLADQEPGSESGVALAPYTLLLPPFFFGPVPLGIPWHNSITCPMAWLFLFFWVFPRWWLVVHLKSSSKLSFIDSKSHQQQMDTEPWPHPRTPFQENYTVTRLLNTLCPTLKSDNGASQSLSLKPPAWNLTTQNTGSWIPFANWSICQEDPGSCVFIDTPVWLL